MLAIIGGTGFYKLDGVTVTKTENVTTPFGDPSGPITRAMYNVVGLATLINLKFLNDFEWNGLKVKAVVEYE